jgi:hypothetical protein
VDRPLRPMTKSHPSSPARVPCGVIRACTGSPRLIASTSNTSDNGSARSAICRRVPVCHGRHPHRLLVASSGQDCQLPLQNERRAAIAVALRSAMREHATCLRRSRVDRAEEFNRDSRADHIGRPRAFIRSSAATIRERENSRRSRKSMTAASSGSRKLMV